MKRVRLPTKVLARVNKGLIRSIVFENCVYLFIDGFRYARALYYLLLLYLGVVRTYPTTLRILIVLTLGVFR